MKLILKLTVILLSVSTIAAQEKPIYRRGGHPGKKTAGSGHNMFHLRFAKNILSEKSIREANITPQQSQILKKEFDLIDSQMYELDQKIRETSRLQAEIALKVLTTPGGNADEMFELTDQIGKLRIEQAKLSVKVLLVIRDTLQPHQCAKVVEMMRDERENMKKRLEQMREQMQERRTLFKETNKTNSMD